MKSMSTSALSQRLFDADVRVEKMFWLGGMNADAPRDFEEFVEDYLEDEKEVLAAFPWLKNNMPPDAGEFLCELAFRRIDGFLVQLATPIPTSFYGDGGYSSSWGYYQTGWFFFETLEALADRAETWRVEVLDRSKKKAAERATENADVAAS